MKLKAKTIVARLKAYYSQHPVLFVIRSLVIVAVVTFFVIRRSFWTPDFLFVVLLGVAIVFGQARAFIVRFLPFLGLLLLYDSFRGYADQLNSHVHYFEMINFDKTLFHGTLPTVALQHLLWRGHVMWYDFYFYFLYTIHFFAPIMLAVLIWKLRDQWYWPYVTAFVLLSFAGFITYVAFPAAPPWMASDAGFIPHITHISSEVWNSMHMVSYSEVYGLFSANSVAAVPSLHSAYPVLFVLFLNKAFGWRRFWWTIIYPISMWTGVMYLGEHYSFDVILGALYAVASYAVTMWFFARQRRAGWPLKARLALIYAHIRKQFSRRTA